MEWLQQSAGRWQNYFYIRSSVLPHWAERQLTVNAAPKCQVSLDLCDMEQYFTSLNKEIATNGNCSRTWILQKLGTRQIRD